MGYLWHVMQEFWEYDWNTNAYIYISVLWENLGKVYLLWMECSTGIFMGWLLLDLRYDISSKDGWVIDC